MIDVKNVLERLSAGMPLDTAEGYDNVGLLIGNGSAPVKTVLCALDLRPKVLDEAEELHADLIVTHHPILFRARKDLRTDDPEGAMLYRAVRSGLALIAMHTNFDAACPGVNDALAGYLGLTGIEPDPSGLRIGDIAGTELGRMAAMAEQKLGGAVRIYGERESKVRRLAVMGGSGGSYGMRALEAGADTFLTGEISYHTALDLVDRGLNVLECGHAATERPAVALLCELLRAVSPELRVVESAVPSFL